MPDGSAADEAALKQLSGLTLAQCDQAAADLCVQGAALYGYTGTLNILARALALTAVNAVLAGAAVSPAKLKQRLLSTFDLLFEAFMAAGLAQLQPPDKKN